MNPRLIYSHVRCLAQVLASLARLLFLLVACPTDSHAQSLQTILTNGPASNRFNIVFLSEGYATNQLAKFASDATNALSVLLSSLPWSDSPAYFNAFAVAVASDQSGSDHPAYGTYRTTYFNSSYDALSDYLITIPPDAFDANYAHGQGKVDALLQSFMPNCALAVLLVNDPVPGGSDGFNKTAIVYAGQGFKDILRHEVGHVAANLGDEYTTPNPGYPDSEEPNTTRQTNLALIKWRAWIPANTPIPTPAIYPYDSVVGLFEGAHYHATGWYRPAVDCTMNHSTFPDFCPVCQEALVLALYGRVRPIDAFVPAATNLTISAPASLHFSFTLVDPGQRDLSLQWQTNGVPITGATNATLSLSPLALGDGTHLLSAMIRNQTALVRTDPANLLTQSVTWSLNVSLSSLRLDSPLLIPDGRFVFRVTGVAPDGFVIQGSADAFAWQNLSTNFLNSGDFWFTNSAPQDPSKQFFRAVAPP